MRPPPLLANFTRTRGCKPICEIFLALPRDAVLCLDRDEPGQTAAGCLQEELQGAGYHSGILLPVHKDWNDDLVLGQSIASSAMTLGRSM